MYHPTRDEFRRKAQQGNLIPVYKEILGDLETPVSAFCKIGKSDYAFLLESLEGGEIVGRYSFLGSEPFLVVESKGQTVTMLRNGSQEKRQLKPGEDPLMVLKSLLAQHRWVSVEGLPRLSGGAVGYLGYDLVRFFEELPDDTEDDLGLPDLLFVFTDTLCVFDHAKHRIKLVSNALVGEDPDRAYDQAVSKIEALAAQLAAPIPFSVSSRSGRKAPALGKITSNLTQAEFESAVAKGKEYIAAGDIIQVVLSQRLTRPVQAPHFDIYRAMRSLGPSPYMYYLSYGEMKIIGCSPERLVSEEDGLVVTRPIAGTRPRGADPAEDERLAQELLADEKERAEHIMLVDLGRNDIGRVCDYGSVEVDKLMEIGWYSHVMHIVSNVRGNLRPDRDQFDVLRACFPAGTVSGAPKIRAMEIIEELEPTKRGPYAGAIGYFSFSGNMDTAITIRTVVISDDTAYLQVGAGIVADSIPEREYQETMNKGEALLRAIDMAEAGLE